MDDPIVDFVYSAWKACLSLPASAVTSLGLTEPLPDFSEAVLVRLCGSMTARLRAQPTVLRLAPPITIVGDIHGSLFDLFRILQSSQPDSKFLFLGDYVDRGEFSLECITVLFALACKFPDRFHLIRGNHECVDVCSIYGFRAEILAAYTDALFTAFCDTFAWLPLAAIVNSTLFCVHGGLGPGLEKIAQIEGIHRPLASSKDCPLLYTLLWADPDPTVQQYGPSTRGVCHTYGVAPVKEFLSENGCTMIIRAHECVEEGVLWHPAMAVVTVFSASNYQQAPPNNSGVVWVTAAGALGREQFVPLPKLERMRAMFYRMHHTGIDSPSRRVSQSLSVSKLFTKVAASQRHMVPSVMSIPSLKFMAECRLNSADLVS
jgi:diadenosine tetraphosphatase ApaH/serine/threonine PP2A family protein phosphatase